ncbi:NYN domain-containing protein [Massilia cavernae]|uniref:NYN domain-containing protein n=1 Tax=Massilia cavernae TaxID=2320864 RepID=A0A418Y7X7_9BURK|nr:NYN domain-containing protein [Massilia cavernae]RJG27219.1 NYN domain-containing protein [Massilia cavernae]
MASSSDNISMAVFCDFENVALGVRDANYEKFDIRPVLERLLLKGSIVVKKAYCDWDRYKGFKSAMHEANFEMIEIPHVRQSGKNSADIRLVVDALDLCYTKSHVDTFVIISGDSDFSPLVSKLRENAKKVIGVGVKQSTSDLLVANCDEFIFYDDLVREVRRAAAKRDERKTQQPSARKAPSDEGNRRKEEMEGRKKEALDLVVEMFDALVSERGDSGKIWASLLKDTLKRRRPDFNESYYGFRTFGNLLEEAQSRGMLEFGRDEKSGAYVYRSNAAPALASAPQVEAAPVPVQETDEAVAEAPAKESRRRGGRGRKKEAAAEPVFEPVAEMPYIPEPEPVEVAPEPEVVAEAEPGVAAKAPAKKKLAPARSRKAAKKSKAVEVVEAPVEVEIPAVSAPTELEAETVGEEAKPKKPARKTASRSRRPAKPKAAPENG